ncbi:MAG: hypothetical protein MJY57_02810 [Bacteroidales bacterium]|nr:hypothetical protein [Bacteroidales bacterium]
MNGILKKILCVVFFLLSVFLVWRIYSGIMEPVNFNKQKAFREGVAIQRMKDIRTLQVAYKSVNGKFVSTVDSLIDFYKKGDMKIVMQIGSEDDSLAMVHTNAVKKGKKLTGKDLYNLYLAGDKKLVFSVESKIPVRDTLFRGRTDFNVDSLKYIPFSGKKPVEMEAVVRMVSGVPVPLFEARMPYKAFLNDLNPQLRINLDAERRDQNKYEGLQVGSVTAPNNNAGNWE